MGGLGESAEAPKNARTICLGEFRGLSRWVPSRCKRILSRRMLVDQPAGACRPGGIHRDSPGKLVPANMLVEHTLTEVRWNSHSAYDLTRDAIGTRGQGGCGRGILDLDKI